MAAERESSPTSVPGATGARRWGERWSGDRRRGALLLVLVVFTVFSGAIGHRATLDSRQFLVEDMRVRELRLGELLTQGYWHRDPHDPAVRPGADLYRPLTLLWLATFWQMATPQQQEEVRPVALNVANVALHALSVVLRFWLFLALLGSRPRAGPVAFFAALLLAVHPIATETVCTQVGAAEGLVAVCGTAALLAWHRWQAHGVARARFSFVLWTTLALLAKENALAIAVLAPLGTRLLLGKPWSACVRVGALAAVPIAVWVLLRLWISGAAAAVAEPVLSGYGAIASLQTALAAIGWYDVPALCWPFHLLAFVSHQALWPPDGFADGRVLAGSAALVAVVVATVVALRRDRVAAFGMLWFMVALLPVSNLVVPIGALAATRFLYLPWTGLALAACIAVANLLAARARGVRRVATALAVGAPSLLVGATLVEVPVWQSQSTLFRTMAARQPDAMAWTNLGAALADEADRAASTDPRTATLRDEAGRAFAAALALPMPQIPGREAVPEDLLELAYQAALQQGLTAVRWRGDFATAERGAATMIDIARRGAAQSGVVRGRTVWPVLEADAECWMGELAMQQAQAPSVAAPRRAEWERVAEACVARARALVPDGLRALELELRVLASRGDPAALAAAFAAAWRRVEPDVGRLSAAARIGLAYARLLERTGQTERSLAVALTTLVEGRDRFDGADAFFDYGMRGLRVGDAQVRALALQALELFVRRADRRDRRVEIARASLRPGR